LPHEAQLLRDGIQYFDILLAHVLQFILSSTDMQIKAVIREARNNAQSKVRKGSFSQTEGFSARRSVFYYPDIAYRHCFSSNGPVLPKKFF
jgi:hypothetical protein